MLSIKESRSTVVASAGHPWRDLMPPQSVTTNPAARPLVGFLRRLRKGYGRSGLRMSGLLDGEEAAGTSPPVGAAPPSLLWSFVVYTVLFAALSLPWLKVADRGAPSGYIGNATDERLIVWVLAWVAHALSTDPSGILDANINHPAPSQLTGSEHFLTAQVVFAPLFALTGNALLAANVTVFLTYPLAALAMQRLLLALGCASGVAWVVGGLFAVGPYRIPAHLHLLQYTNLFLPLVALALTRMRSRPAAATAVRLALALLVTVLSSFYMAVLGGIVALVWGVFELCRAGDLRVRFVVLAVATATLVAVGFLVSSLPYLVRPEAGAEAAWSWATEVQRAGLLSAYAGIVTRSAGDLTLYMAGLGTIAFLSRDVGARVCAQRGLLFVVLGQVMTRGSVLVFPDMTIPTPFALIAASPLRFFRYPVRCVLLVGFGCALLAAGALQTVYARLGRRAGWVAVVVTAIALVATRGVQLSGNAISEFPGQTDTGYELLSLVPRSRWPGALLELPFLPPLTREEIEGVGTEAESMLASTRHWLPLVLGFTGYQPPHRQLVLREVLHLPDERSLERLVSMTRLRWILLQPIDRWPADDHAQREAIRTSPVLQLVGSNDGWDLLRVKQQAKKQAWYDAIAGGPRPGQTILGTALAPIAEKNAIGVVRGSIAPMVEPDGFTYLALLVRNEGSAAWPVNVPAQAEGDPNVVRLVVEWRSSGAPAGTTPVWTQVVPLPIDVVPNDVVSFAAWLKAPAEPGEYDVLLRIEQRAGAKFSGRGNLPLHGQVRVTAQDGA